MTLQQLLGVQFPIIQAPMAGFQASEMAIAVSGAGGLGSLPCALLNFHAMQTELTAIRARTDKPFNVNFFFQSTFVHSQGRDILLHRCMPELPVETWSTIFQFVIQLDDTLSSRTKLLRINQYWRNIATTTPKLWTHLYIHATNTSPVQFHLKNSGSLPLDIQIKLLRSSARDRSALTKILAEHLSRIRLLEINVPEHYGADKLIAQLGCGQSAPILESICIQVKNQPRDPVPSFASLHYAFSSTPRLARLSLPAYPLPKPTCPLFSSSALTDLILDAIPFGANINEDMIFATITALKNLQSFTFKSSDIFSYCDASTFPNIDAPHLVSVDVSAPGWGLDILGTFHAPLLTCVRFDALREYHIDRIPMYTEPISTSLRLLSQRSPHIKQLELCGTVLHQPEEDYQWLFGTAFPLLEVLRFEETDITDDLMELGAKRMPSLIMLELSACKCVSGPGLFSFLQLREKNVSTCSRRVSPHYGRCCGGPFKSYHSTI